VGDKQGDDVRLEVHYIRSQESGARTQESGARTQESEYRIQEPELRSQNSGVRMKRQPAKDFQDLIVWQKAHQLVLSIYRFTDAFPQSELYGLARLNSGS